MRLYKFLSAHFALKSLYERRLKISAFNDLNDPLELLPYNVRNKKHRKAAYALRERLQTQFGTLCFSKDWENPVIWSHYADRYYGFCLGFNVPDDKIHPVTYREDRPPFAATQLSHQAFVELTTTKFKSWEYEKEVRMVLSLPSTEDGTFYHDFGSDLELAEVIGGHRCTVPRAAIERALANQTSRVTLIKARVAFGKFEVRAKASGWM